MSTQSNTPIKLKELEKQASGTQVALSDFFQQVRFDAKGLIPAIAQQHDSKEVLMMAWMNQASLTETIETKQVCYYSRSRQSLWRKGESSGQVQRLVSIAFDCDADTLLLLVDQTGAACHSGRRDCFFYAVADDEIIINSDPIVDPDTLY